MFSTYFSLPFQKAGKVNFQTTGGVENNLKVKELMKEGELLLQQIHKVSFQSWSNASSGV